SLAARSALSFRKSTYPRTIAWRFCWSRLSRRPSLAAARPLMSASLRSRSAATTASPPAAYTFGASGASAVSARASVRSSGIGGRLHAADTGKLVGRGEGERFLDGPPGRGLRKRLAAHDRPPVRLRLFARELEGLLAAQRLDDLVAHRVERLHAAGLVLVRPEDVEAEGRLDDVAHLAGLEREGGALERRRHRAAAEEAEVAPLRGGPRVVGVLARERGE